MHFDVALKLIFMFYIESLERMCRFHGAREDNLTSKCICYTYTDIKYGMYSYACILKVQCDLCERWYHQKYIEQHLKEKLEDENRKLAFTGPCCSKDGYIFIA